MEIRVPNKLLAEFLQYCRDFDVKHFDEVVLKIGVDCPGLTVDQCAALIAGVKPPFSGPFVKGKCT
jgi:glycosyltransferase A (GT-A) superfamily protein (DUF2064 family)